jgi:hypothetical protein
MGELITSLVLGAAKQAPALACRHASSCCVRVSISAGVGCRLWPFTMGPGSNRCPIIHVPVSAPVRAIAFPADIRLNPNANATRCFISMRPFIAAKQRRGDALVPP